MRKNQVQITINRYNDQAFNNQIETINIYADSNNIYEALSGAYMLALNKVGNPAIRYDLIEEKEGRR